MENIDVIIDYSIARLSLISTAAAVGEAMLELPEIPSQEGFSWAVESLVEKCF